MNDRSRATSAEPREDGPATADEGQPTRWRFVLYKAGDRKVMRRAEATLREIGDRYLDGEYDLEVIDVLDPDAEFPPDVLALPTTIRVQPTPERRLVGDMSQVRSAAERLGLTDEERNDE